MGLQHGRGGRRRARRIFACIALELLPRDRGILRRDVQVPASIGEHQLRADADRLQHQHALVAPRSRVLLVQLDELGRCLAVPVGHAFRPGARTSGTQRAIQEGQAHVHAVVDVGVVIVELLVAVLDPRRRQPFRQQPRPVVDVELVAPPAVDVDPAQLAQVPAVALR